MSTDSPTPPLTPEQLEAQALEAEKKWLAEVYQPGAVEMTVRSVITGMLLGCLMCFANLYVVLKTGWSVGVTITACIVAWAIWTAVASVLGPKWRMGILENNFMGSVASAAGYMTGGGNMAALPALIMLTGQRPDSTLLMAWFACIAGLGVFAAIPIKRQLINREQLIFPTGTATAETLRALNAKDSTGAKQARFLFGAAGIAAVIAFLRDAKTPWKQWKTPSEFSLPVDFHGKPLLDWTLGMEGSVLMLGAGSLMSWRTGWSLLLGALITFGIVAPEMVSEGVIAEVSFKVMAKWTVWMGAAVLVSSGLTSFAFQWRSVLKSVRSLGALFSRKKDGEKDPLEDIEAPQTWFPLGFLVLGPPLVVLAWVMFDIPLWAGMIALPLSVVMGVIAARVTGETDVTPTKALGPVTQLTYAGLLPGQLAPNIMSANITGGVGLHAADLLTALKSGYLVGANPRKQVIGQFFGVFAGALVIVPLFNLLVPTADVLGSKDFPAPSVMVWKNVSEMLVKGVEALHPTARWAALAGLIVGTTLAILEVKVPKKMKKYVPSASGLGIAMVLPAWNSIMMCIGAGLAEYLRQKKGEKEGDAITMPIGSGFVAGESLMGVIIKVLIAIGWMQK
ncbi:MAG: OPT family oligopeptide transporter [Myxococcaceae bacterium]